MSKRLSILIAVLLSMLLFPTSVSAHVLIKNQVGGTGAILHTDPDDDPIAGKQVTLFFDIQDSTITPQSSQARLTIVDERGISSAVPSEIIGPGVSAEYVFPRQGLYKIQLAIKQGGTTTHIFSESQRVSRGTIGDASASSAPAWAKGGIVATVLGAAFTAIIAFNRRKVINKYSK